MSARVWCVCVGGPVGPGGGEGVAAGPSSSSLSTSTSASSRDTSSSSSSFYPHAYQPNPQRPGGGGGGYPHTLPPPPHQQAGAGGGVYSSSSSSSSSYSLPSLDQQQHQQQSLPLPSSSSRPDGTAGVPYNHHVYRNPHTPGLSSSSSSAPPFQKEAPSASLSQPSSSYASNGQAGAYRAPYHREATRGGGGGSVLVCSVSGHPCEGEESSYYGSRASHANSQHQPHSQHPHQQPGRTIGGVYTPDGSGGVYRQSAGVMVTAGTSLHPHHAPQLLGGGGGGAFPRGGPAAAPRGGERDGDGRKEGRGSGRGGGGGDGMFEAAYNKRFVGSFRSFSSVAFRCISMAVEQKQEDWFSL